MMMIMMMMTMMPVMIRRRVGAWRRSRMSNKCPPFRFYIGIDKTMIT